MRAVRTDNPDRSASCCANASTADLTLGIASEVQGQRQALVLDAHLFGPAHVRDLEHFVDDRVATRAGIGMIDARRRRGRPRARRGPASTTDGGSHRARNDTGRPTAPRRRRTDARARRAARARRPTGARPRVRRRSSPASRRSRSGSRHAPRRPQTRAGHRHIASLALSWGRSSCCPRRHRRQSAHPCRSAPRCWRPSDRRPQAVEDSATAARPTGSVRASPRSAARRRRSRA